MPLSKNIMYFNLTRRQAKKDIQVSLQLPNTHHKKQKMEFLNLWQQQKKIETQLKQLMVKEEYNCLSSKILVF